MELSGAKPIITEMLMGHTVGVANSYMKPTREELVGEYVKAIPNLTIVGAVVEKADRKTEFKREILLKVGGYSKEEVDKLDLASMEDAEIQKLVRERLLGAMTNNGNHQRVIPINEVETYLTKEWEYVAALLLTALFPKYDISSVVSSFAFPSSAGVHEFRRGLIFNPSNDAARGEGMLYYH